MTEQPDWHRIVFADPEQAVKDIPDLLKSEKVGPGEAIVFTEDDGAVSFINLRPGSGGGKKEWRYRDFENAARLVEFLSETPRQGPGEAIVFQRPNGSPGLFYLE